VNKKKQHPFERTIGPGPYKYIGFGKIHFSETFGARYIGPECERGCGTCAHCGTAIMNIFVIQAGDGKNYGVGCDCIAGSTLPYEVKSAAEQGRLKYERKLRDERNQKKRERQKDLDAKELHAFVSVWSTPEFQDSKFVIAFKRQPHPNEWMAKERGLSIFDYIEWNIKNKNHRGLRPYAFIIDDFEALKKERVG
jgi:hypothetical protein